MQNENDPSPTQNSRSRRRRQSRNRNRKNKKILAPAGETTNNGASSSSRKTKRKQDQQSQQNKVNQCSSSSSSSVAYDDLKDEGAWLASISLDGFQNKSLAKVVEFIVRFKLIQTDEQLDKIERAELTGPVVPSGKRHPSKGVEEEEQGILLIQLNGDSDLSLHITQLVAGFLIGPKGVSIRDISRITGCHLKSWTVDDKCPRPYRNFVLEGTPQQLLQTLDIMLAAIGRYKELAEGQCKGMSVNRIQRIKGLDFFYYPPPKTKIPFAASIQGAPSGYSGSNGSANCEQLGDDRFVLENRGSKPTPLTLRRALRLSEENIDDVGSKHIGLYPGKQYMRTTNSRSSKKQASKKQQQNKSNNGNVNNLNSQASSRAAVSEALCSKEDHGTHALVVPDTDNIGSVSDNTTLQDPYILPEDWMMEADLELQNKRAPRVAPVPTSPTQSGENGTHQSSLKIQDLLEQIGSTIDQVQLQSGVTDLEQDQSVLLSNVQCNVPFAQDLVRNQPVIECNFFHPAIGYEVFDRLREQEQKSLYYLFSPEQPYSRQQTERNPADLQSICKFLTEIVEGIEYENSGSRYLQEQGSGTGQVSFVDLLLDQITSSSENTLYSAMSTTQFAKRDAHGHSCTNSSTFDSVEQHLDTSVINSQ
eukprot:TRINITY_DN1532_c0_g2_i2.p1 TRINITY_DN1532_c0_g2~~TRINITY_DN1532_c0_g2_i2.p1  ORF type:complete len:646 (+),score=56.39 TRINITY_DN1532_c0_g2_i2:254-2191(+)